MNFIEQLNFDRELVQRIRETKTNNELLYIHLISGKITLKEYLAAI
jgi:hypothetical protein